MSGLTSRRTARPGCDFCGRPNATMETDSAIGLEAWNAQHPADQRTRLYICSLVCCFNLGWELGGGAA
jgi:hypothetical protein